MRQTDGIASCGPIRTNRECRSLWDLASESRGNSKLELELCPGGAYLASGNQPF